MAIPMAAPSIKEILWPLNMSSSLGLLSKIKNDVIAIKMVKKCSVRNGTSKLPLLYEERKSQILVSAKSNGMVRPVYLLFNVYRMNAINK